MYANGQVHRVYVKDGYVTHIAGKPTSDSTTSPNYVFAAGTEVKSPYGVYRYRAGIYGEGIAVYNNKIYFTYTADYSHTQADPPIHAYVAVFDMSAGINSWVLNKDLGPVHTDTLGKGYGQGAAVVVFQNTLYVFTNYDTYTSTDGVSFATLQKSPWPLAGKDYQPLDAIVLYPPDKDPLVQIVYGYQSSWGSYFSSILGTIWDGSVTVKPTLTGVYNYAHYGHVSLTPGTVASTNDFSAGQKTASVQLFVETSDAKDDSPRIRRLEYAYGNGGSTWTLDPNVYKDGDSLGSLWVYPWYTITCNPANPTTKVQHQHIAVNYTTDSDQKKWKAFAFDSDFLVPQNPLIHATSCDGWNGNWGGTGTNTGKGDATTAATLQKYWSLVGVVLGSPPYALNKLTEVTEIAALSNLMYGKETGVGVSQSETWGNTGIFSAGLQVGAGFFDDFLEVEDRADISYKRGWESGHETSTSTVQGIKITMGTDPDSEDEAKRGRWGWGLFLVPNVIVQDFALYAYDYDLANPTKATSLNQNLHTININPDAVSYKAVGFDLTNPGSTESDVPGLMAGMSSFPVSTDLDGWMALNWETNDKQWTVQLGDGSLSETGIQPLEFGSGTKTSTSFTSTSDSVDSSGQTTNVEISNEVSVSLALLGFKASLKAGHESSYSAKISNTTSFKTDLEAELNMKSCPDPDCVKTLTVQPYLLKPVDGTAPWIPTGYKQQRPWCITWSAWHTSPNQGVTAGRSSAPDATAGVIVGGQGASSTAGESRFSSYSLEGAFLGWVSRKGEETAIPMTAADFKPAKGVTVSLNRFSWSSGNASGTWTRLGKVWLFESRPSAARNKVVLRLDFGRGTWDFHISKAELGAVLAAGDGEVQVRLKVNGKYLLQHDVKHHVDMAWRWRGDATQPHRMELTQYEGRHSSSTQTGTALLHGTLPSVVEEFGDMSFDINGREVHVPLLALEEYVRTRATEGILHYAKNGVDLKVDFKRKLWALSLEAGGYHRLQSPRWGTSRIRVKVGGTTWHTTEIPVSDFTSRLRLKG